MAIRAVIFDLGGVLVRTEDSGPRQALAERLGMTVGELGNLIFDSETAIRATLGEISAQAHWDAVRKALGLQDEAFVSIPVDFWGGDTLDTELVEYIRSLRSRYKTALLSNAWDDLRAMLAQEWQIEDAFDVIIISAEVRCAKPVEQIYRIALERLEVDPFEAVFIDDYPPNIEGARALGMHAIRFEGPEQARDELERLLDSKGDVEFKHKGHGV
jgi:epoxide hydrolase-like predicted phosphatase